MISGAVLTQSLPHTGHSMVVALISSHRNFAKQSRTGTIGAGLPENLKNVAVGSNGTGERERTKIAMGLMRFERMTARL